MKTGAGNDRIHLAAQDRNIANRLIVNVGGKQPREQPFAGHVSAAVEFFDADRIEMRGAMYRRPAIGLADHQDGRRTEEIGNVRWQFRLIQQPFEDSRQRFPQNSETAFVFDPQLCLFPLGGKDIFAIAEEGKMVVFDPA
ncbi:MAG: hypothetical protein V3S24_14370, partial [Candidatus Tectomicrobia bacterium]